MAFKIFLIWIISTLIIDWLLREQSANKFDLMMVKNENILLEPSSSWLLKICRKVSNKLVRQTLVVKIV